MVHTGDDPAFVALSIVIAVFASYAAPDLGARVRRRDAGLRWVRGAGAAVATGGGIWSMHFTGMLAFETGTPGSGERYGTAIFPANHRMPDGCPA